MTARLARTGAAGLFALVLVAQGTSAAGTETLVLKTDSGEHRFHVELADTNEERALGLMYRRSLPEDGGMLFLYDRPRPATMWMKNTLIPLDMVFIRADGTIARITTARPLDETPVPSGEPIAAVLEIAGGRSTLLGVAEGDKVDWKR